jgi:hypothetical protein
VPWRNVLSFSDSFPCQAAIQAAEVELFPIAKGKFRAELTRVGLNQLWMQRFHQHLPQVNAAVIKPGRRIIGFQTRGYQPAMQHCGMDVVPGNIIVNASA